MSAKTLDQRVPRVFTSDFQGNEFTPDLRYRGFRQPWR
jgi:hypothetical protein